MDLLLILKKCDVIRPHPHYTLNDETQFFNPLKDIKFFESNLISWLVPLYNVAAKNLIVKDFYT